MIGLKQCWWQMSEPLVRKDLGNPVEFIPEALPVKPTIAATVGTSTARRTLVVQPWMMFGRT